MEKQERKFEAIFFKIIIVLTILFAILFFYFGIILNEGYFLKFSLDKKLRAETIGKINMLRVTLLLASSLIFVLILLFVNFKKKVVTFVTKHRKFVQNIFLLFFVLLFILIIGEIILKMIIGEQTIGGGFGPGSIKFNQKYVHLNNEGMRDRRFSIIKPEDTVRIAVLGDSFSFGSGIKEVNNTYPKLLEKKLNGLSYKYNYEVLNFGFPGENTGEEIRILKEKTLKYSPDAIVIGYVLNDIKNIDRDVTEYKFVSLVPYIGFWIRNVLYSYSYAEFKLNYILDSLGLKKNVIESILDTYASEMNREYNDKLFEELRNIAEKNKIKIVIMIFPGLVKFDDYPYKEVHEYIIETSEKNGFYVLDLFDSYKEYEENRLQISTYDTHPNELGHRLAAEAILVKLINEKIILI